MARFSQSTEHRAQRTAYLYRSATAACLTAIIVMQIVNVFICRSAVRSVFSTPLFDNHVILAGVALEIGLVVLFDYSAWGNLLLHTAPVPPSLWLLLLPLAIAMLQAEEVRKLLVRRALQASSGHRPGVVARRQPRWHGSLRSRCIT